MKKSLSVLSLLFGLFVCVTVFSACGGDDEPSSGGNNGSSNNNQTPSNPKDFKNISEKEVVDFLDKYIDLNKNNKDEDL